MDIFTPLFAAKRGKYKKIQTYLHHTPYNWFLLWNTTYHKPIRLVAIDGN